MTLEEALKCISASRYFSFCGLKYCGLGDFKNDKYSDLSPVMQLGIRKILESLYNTQKLIYHYEFDYVIHQMKESGINFKCFFAECGFPKSFYGQRYLSEKKREERLRIIKLELIKILNRLFEYLLEDKSHQHIRVCSP